MSPIVRDKPLDAFLRQIPQTPRESEEARAPRRVLTQGSALILNREQEDRLAWLCHEQRRKLEEQTGRQYVMDGTWLHGGSTGIDMAPVDRSFMGRRELYSMIYRLELDWRPFLEGGLYEYSNDHLPLTHRFLRQQIARAQNYFFETDPWCAVVAVGPNDDHIAQAIDRWGKWGLSEAQVVDKAFNPGIEAAFVLGECVLKDTWKIETDRYFTFAEVLVNPQAQPVMAQDGDYIYRNDAWAMDSQSGRFVLVRDRVTPLPEWIRDPGSAVEWFAMLRVPKTRTLYKGLDIGCLHFKDLLVPIDAPSLEEADCKIHLFDMEVGRVADQYLSMMRKTGDAGDLPRVIDLLRGMNNNTQKGVSALHKPRPDLGETSLSGERNHWLNESEESGSESRNPRVGMGECWLRADVDGDGEREHIMCLMDWEQQRPIFYDYVSNLTPDGRSPFHVLRVNPLANRWHGVAQTEFFWRLNKSMDHYFNRISLSLSKEGRVDAVDETAVYEGDDNPNLEINGDTVYHLKPGRTIDEFISSKMLTDIKAEHLREVIMDLQQWGANMSNVATPNDGRSAGLDSSELATGIRNQEMSGQEGFAPFLKSLIVGLKSSTKQGLYIIRSNMDDQETFRFFNDAQWMAEVIRKIDIQDLRFDIEIQVTKHRALQEAMQITNGIAMVERFIGYPPELKGALLGWYRKKLEIFQLPGADNVLQIAMSLPPLLLGGAPMPPDPGQEAAMGQSQPVSSSPNL